MEKLCLNCKHFVQHYHLNCLNRICPTNCGLCKLKKVNDKQRKKSALDEACKLWETNEKDADSLEWTLENNLENIVEQLNKIIQKFNSEK